VGNVDSDFHSLSIKKYTRIFRKYQQKIIPHGSISISCGCSALTVHMHYGKRSDGYTALHYHFMVA